MLLPNSPPYVIGYYAILKVGGIVVTLNPLAVEREILHLLKHAEVRTILVADPLFSRIAQVAPQSSLENILIACLREWAEAKKPFEGPKVSFPPKRSKGNLSIGIRCWRSTPAKKFRPFLCIRRMRQSCNTQERSGGNQRGSPDPWQPGGQYPANQQLDRPGSQGEGGRHLRPSFFPCLRDGCGHERPHPSGRDSDHPAPI